MAFVTHSRQLLTVSLAFSECYTRHSFVLIRIGKSCAFAVIPLRERRLCYCLHLLILLEQGYSFSYNGIFCGIKCEGES